MRKYLSSLLAESRLFPTLDEMETCDRSRNLGTTVVFARIPVSQTVDTQAKNLVTNTGEALTTHCLNAWAIVRRLFSQFQACDALSGPSEAPGSSKTGFFYVSLFDLRIPRANDSIPRDTPPVSKP